MSCPSIWATPSALLINILLGSFQLFLHSDQPLWGWNNPVQRCLPVGEAALSTPEAVVASRTDWQTALMCKLTTTSGNIISADIIFSFLASLTLRVFASSAATSRWRICMSVIAAFASFSSSGIFVALGFAGNGVITAMINSPWQADDMQITRWDNRGDLLIHQSLTVPPASLNFAIRLSALYSNWP